ncbi:MAG: hypothetical protein L3J41_17210 [Melioribacteraceae bacterium]|nr:hypothetical protein [Melioribacteraceae bacterium]
MEILESIIHPQSFQRIELLSYLTTLAYMILLPYLGLLLSATLLSSLFNSRGKSSKNIHFIKLAKDVISIPTFNLIASLGLILFPLFALMFTYAQLIQESSQLVFDNLFYLIFLIIPAIFLIYIYKNSFALKGIAKLVNKTKETDTDQEKGFAIYKTWEFKLLTNSSLLAFFLLLVSSYILLAGISLISDSSRWETITSLSDMLWNESTLISFLFFLSVSLALTSVLALYLYFKPDSYHEKSDRKYSDLMKKFFLNTAIIFVIVQPLLYALDVMSVPSVALSNSLFGISIGVLTLLLIIVSLLYHMIKENELKYRGVVLFLFIGLFALLAMKVQVGFNTSSQLQIQEVIKAHDVHATEIKEQLDLK